MFFHPNRNLTSCTYVVFLSFCRTCSARGMPYKINVGLVALAALAAAALAHPTMDRRASMGFMGMRGKKDDQGGDSGGGGDDTSAAAAVELDKRTLVFRRPLFDGDRTVLGGDGSVEGFKRAMGFMGMRGKKEYYKGSAAAGFFGMRGKKVPSTDAFFGVRGKKWPASVSQPLASRDDGADDVDVERAVLALHRIINNLRSDQGERRVAPIYTSTLSQKLRFPCLPVCVCVWGGEVYFFKYYSTITTCCVCVSS